jgi:methylamine--corrinoid protein Co-methyltransferase
MIEGVIEISVDAFLEILDRAHKGVPCEAKDWDRKIISSKVSEKLKEHGLKGTCRPECPINTDDSLADEFFKAGFDLAVETGMLCLDTERVIKFTEEEIRKTIDRAPSELALGQGPDRRVIRARKPEDSIKPIAVSPLSIVVSEELWVPLVQGIMETKEVDVIEGPSFETICGRPIMAGTPYETLSGMLAARFHKEAARRAGRPNMGFLAVGASPTIFGQFGGYGVVGGYDPKNTVALVLSPCEMKTSYASLHKVAHAINCGGIVYGGSWSMIGGFPGPPEGAALAGIACTLLQWAVHLASWGTCNPMDIRYMGNCGPEAQWALSVFCQSLSRNTHLLVCAIPNSVAGPCTDMLLRETAAATINIATSGASSADGPRSAGGRYTNYLTPLECKFMAEVLHGSAGIKRDHANEVVRKLIHEYEGELRHPPKGKSFPECYNIKTLEPSREWLDTYLRVRRELKDLGIPLDDL